MLEEPSATTSSNRSMIPSILTFYVCLFIQRKESCVNGFLALTFILSLRGLLRHVYMLQCSLPCIPSGMKYKQNRTCIWFEFQEYFFFPFYYELSFLPVLWLILIGCNNQDFGPNGWQTRSCYWKLHRWKFGSIING